MIRRFLHNSTILKALSFLSVDAPFGAGYNWKYPLSISALLAVLGVMLGADVNYWGKDGLLTALTPLLSVLFPFYVAALAAVATFKGVADLDKPFPLDAEERRVTMPRMGSGGVIEFIEITQRHYLSLLFGYCAVVSIALIFFYTVFRFVTVSISPPIPGYVTYFGYGLLLIFIFLFCQVILLTLVAVYYLSDRIHVSKEEKGNDTIDEAVRRSKQNIKEVMNDE